MTTIDTTIFHSMNRRFNDNYYDNLIPVVTTTGFTSPDFVKKMQENELPLEYKVIDFDNEDTTDFVNFYSYGVNGLTYRTGVSKITFGKDDTYFTCYIVSDYTLDQYENIVINCIIYVPPAFVEDWKEIQSWAYRELEKLSDILRPGDVRFVGGHDHDIQDRYDFDDVILDSKDEIRDSMYSFFNNVQIYHERNIAPFRKLLFTGVPGTGKTMLSFALASEFAKNKHGAVIIVSSDDIYENSFLKISGAIKQAGNSDCPVIIIVEDFDNYLINPKMQSLVLNVLDGIEVPHTNRHGILLIATTNYPEEIDERILNRPGRIDEIHIFPKAEPTAAVEIARNILGEVWKDEFASVFVSCKDLPMSAVKEVCLRALLHTISKNLMLTTEILEGILININKTVKWDGDLRSNRQKEMGLGASMEGKAMKSKTSLPSSLSPLRGKDVSVDKPRIRQDG